MLTGEPGPPVSLHPISWFQAKLIRNPSMFVLGEPGLGKTQLMMRLSTYAHAAGQIPVVLGDVRPDYVEMIRAFGGQIVPLGDGLHFLNILDPGEMPQAIGLLETAAAEAESVGDRDRAEELVAYADELRADFTQRRQAMVFALLEIGRGEALKTVEKNVLEAALHHLDVTMSETPILGDLLNVIREAPARVRAVAVDRGEISRYRKKTEQLEEDLIGLTSGGGLGTTFAQHTTEPMRRDSPVAYDISAISPTNKPLLAAALLACWTTGFGTINVATVLADAGLEPQRHYFVVLDEVHRAFQAGSGVIDYLDLVTRLNRSWQVGQVMITHTMKDLEAVANKVDRLKVRGFIERSSIVVLGGLPSGEIKLIRKVRRITAAEENLITSWSSPPNIAADPRTQIVVPPGIGNFLIKVGNAPGIPFHMIATARELSFNRSSSRWANASRIGKRTKEGASL